MKITLAQLNPIIGDVNGNLQLALAACRRAAASGSDLIVFSELFLSGYPARDLLERCLERLDPSERALLRLLEVHSERRLEDILGVSRRQIRNQLDLIRAKCSDLKKSD